MSETTNRITLTVSAVLKDLDEGLTRKEIGNKYNLSASDVKRLFAHSALKGKKPRKLPGFILVDDTTEAGQEGSSYVGDVPIPTTSSSSTSNEPAITLSDSPSITSVDNLSGSTRLDSNPNQLDLEEEINKIEESEGQSLY